MRMGPSDSIWSLNAEFHTLQEQIKSLRTEAENAQAEARSLREREEVWDTSKFKLESKMRDHEGESQRVSILMSSFETERQVDMFMIVVLIRDM